jgi:hypothetical protein
MTRLAPWGKLIGVRGLPSFVVSRDESNFFPSVSQPV